MFGKKKSGKSTFINKIFKECKTNNSYANSTIGINLYRIEGIKNFSIIDTPGDTEIYECIKEFASKGYIYSKMLFYIISEESTLASDSLEDNKNLGSIIELKIKYKIPLFILLTHSDTYCKKVYSQDDENWKQICKNNINSNKINLLSYIKKQIENKNLDYQMDSQEFENNIIHVVLEEHKEITEDKAIKKMSKRLREKYDKEKNEERKKDMLENFIDGLEAEQKEIKDFFDKEGLNILDKQKLIEKIKEIFPSQYHSVFNI